MLCFLCVSTIETRTSKRQMECLTGVSGCNLVGASPKPSRLQHQSRPNHYNTRTLAIILSSSNVFYSPLNTIGNAVDGALKYTIFAECSSFSCVLCYGDSSIDLYYRCPLQSCEHGSVGNGCPFPEVNTTL